MPQDVTFGLRSTAVWGRIISLTWRLQARIPLSRALRFSRADYKAVVDQMRANLAAVS